jgi:hypothetical protein
MRIKAILPSALDRISALNLSYYSQSIESVVAYTPLFTTKEFVVSQHRSLRISDIRDSDLEAGEGWVISQLGNAKYGSGVSLTYQDLLGVADYDDVAEFRRRLKFAASFATIANIQSQGVGNTVIGPMLSVSADGMSKSHGYFNSGSANYRKVDGIALTYEEKAARELNGILQFWFARGYNEVKEFAARRNEFYEPDYNANAAEVRRKNQWNPVRYRVPP